MSTDAIDNVQNSNDPKENPDFKKFFANFGVTTGIIIGFVVLGSIGLYIAKISYLEFCQQIHYLNRILAMIILTQLNQGILK